MPYGRAGGGGDRAGTGDCLESGGDIAALVGREFLLLTAVAALAGLPAAWLAIQRYLAAEALSSENSVTHGGRSSSAGAC